MMLAFATTILILLAPLCYAVLDIGRTEVQIGAAHVAGKRADLLCESILAVAAPRLDGGFQISGPVELEGIGAGTLAATIAEVDADGNEIAVDVVASTISPARTCRVQHRRLTATDPWTTTSSWRSQ